MSLPITPPPSPILHEAAARALGEDRGPADITTLALVAPDLRCRARIVAKEEGVLSGMPVVRELFRAVGDSIAVESSMEDGTGFEIGDTVLVAVGLARELLTVERSVLNFLQHLSGISTCTAAFVKETEGTKARILDTRKTTPGLRALEKYAVRCGGGVNHRMGLYDAFMAKDNHVAFMQGAGSLKQAVETMRAYEPQAWLTFEADTLEQVTVLADAGVDQILLDNMTNQEMAQAVEIVAGRCKLEASGNMRIERIASVAALGVDFISVGAITQSARALDMGMEINPLE